MNDTAANNISTLDASVAAEAKARPLAAPVDEGHARMLLSTRFRAAGFRILYDVLLSSPGLEVTVDGYDPAKRVGFEYVATEERRTDLTAAEQASLHNHNTYKVLVVEATDAASITAAATQFLQKLKDNSGSDQR